jgi:hypothetical protein
LPEVDGRIDHFAIDVKGRRAFLAALAENTIEVVDLRAGRATHTLPGFAKPQGVLFVPRFNKLVIASGADGAVKMLDGTTLAVIHTTNVSLGADAIGYDPRSHASQRARSRAHRYSYRNGINFTSPCRAIKNAARNCACSPPSREMSPANQPVNQ